MEKHFMIDIEATGIDPAKEDLLSIGVLEADFNGTQWIPGRTIELFQHTERSPESSFAKEHMAELYDVCNRAPLWKAEDLRWRLLKFFKDCGAESPNVYMMGWNASNFDLPFLVAKGVLVPSYYEPDADGKDVMRGDFHYRVYELGGALSLTSNAKPKVNRAELIAEAEGLDTAVTLIPGKQHDALYDCFRQLKILNGLIHMARRGY